MQSFDLEGLLCRLAWTALGNVYIRTRRYNAPRPCRAIPPRLGVAYSPNVVEQEFSEVRSEIIWPTVLFWDFYRDELCLWDHNCTLMVYIVEEGGLLSRSDES
jgi:hypothetical protein